MAEAAETDALTGGQVSEVSASLYEDHGGQCAPPLLSGFHSVLAIFAFLCLVETSLQSQLSDHVAFCAPVCFQIYPM